MIFVFDRIYIYIYVCIWKKEARTAKDDVATNSDGRAERDGAIVG